MGKKKKMIFISTFAEYHSVKGGTTGGSGTVVSVEDQDGHPYALKYLTPHSITKGKMKRFKNELTFCQKIDHPNIVKVLDHGPVEIEGKPSLFYVMPFFQMNLREVMNAGIKPDNVLRLFSDILDGVEAAHKSGVFHRDLKPENILQDDAGRLVVADFGIASFTAEYRATLIVTSPQERLANFQYAAPEQREKGDNVDHRADIYALGLLLNQLFTGKLAHGNGYKQIADVSDKHAYLDDLVKVTLNQNPDDRPKSIEEIKQQLIARQNNFITLQKINVLKNTVVPANDIHDDPLIAEPVRITHVEWWSGQLHFTLSQEVNPMWIAGFKSPRQNFNFIQGTEPGLFNFARKTANVSCQEGSAQAVVDNTKHYVSMANDAYVARVRSVEIKRVKEEEERLRKQQEAEAQRLRINSKLKL